MSWCRSGEIPELSLPVDFKGPESCLLSVSILCVWFGCVVNDVF